MDLTKMNSEEVRNVIENCPVNYAMNKIGGKWKPLILHRIKVGVNRFGILQKAIPNIREAIKILIEARLFTIPVIPGLLI